MSASKRHANGTFGCILGIPPVICMQVVGDGRARDGDHLLLGIGTCRRCGADQSRRTALGAPVSRGPSEAGGATGS